jgi:hypothetical protein
MEHDSERRIPYQDTLGFKLMQETLPGRMTAGATEMLRGIAQSLGSVNLDNVESVVAVVRSKSDKFSDGQQGFRIDFITLGNEQLVIASVLMLYEAVAEAALANAIAEAPVEAPGPPAVGNDKPTVN